MMGFNPEAVEYAAAKVDYQDVERVIEYLTEKDIQDRFTHEFVKGQGDLCFLCFDVVGNHTPLRANQAGVIDGGDFIDFEDE